MVRVGIDLECIDRFALVLKPGGEAFYQRVYTPSERMTFGRSLELLALAFTAKEAVAKVLGTGLSPDTAHGVTGQEIEIYLASPPDQHLAVVFRGKAQGVASRLGLSEVLLCWARNRRLACTVAVGGKDLPRGVWHEALRVALRSMLGDCDAEKNPTDRDRGRGRNG